MKKSIFLVLLALICGMTPAYTHAQREYSKDCRKEAQKNSKKRTKELKKEKWVYSGATPLETKLERFFLETGECGGCKEYTSEINNVNKVMIGENAAGRDISNYLITMLYEEVKGISENEVNEDEASFRNRFASKFKGTLSLVYSKELTLHKKNSSGKYDVIVYYIIDQEKVSKFAKIATEDLDNKDKRSDNIREAIKREFGED